MTTIEMFRESLEPAEDVPTGIDVINAIRQRVASLDPQETMRVNGHDVTYAIAPAGVLAVIEGRRWAVAKVMKLSDEYAQGLSIAEVNARYNSIVP